MLQAIHINPQDSVAVAVTDLMAGSRIPVGGKIVELTQNVPHGFKFAVRNIHSGEHIIKYGYSIGIAKTDIFCGQRVHVDNMRSGLEGHEKYSYNPILPEVKTEKTRVFNGYKRKDGRSAIRNELWIIPGVGCVSELCKRLANENQDLVKKYHLDGLYALQHQYGCSQLGDDNQMTQEFLSRLVNHPNAGGVLVVSLGCENNIPEKFKECIIRSAGDEWNSERVRFIICQNIDDEIEEGRKFLKELAEYASQFKREELPSSSLVLGMKCGGSDGMSGLTANPLLGKVSDKIIRQGGNAIITEVPEMFGAEHVLLKRCKNKEVFDHAVKMLNDFRDYFIKNDEPLYSNPAPGNYEGGISSLEDKSLGCIQKGGSTAITDVIPYAGQVREKGLSILNGPGSDMVSAPNLAAAGSHLVLFTTGRGTPYNTIVPTIKVCSNSYTYNKKKAWFDCNAGRIAEGISIEEMADSLFDLVLRVASGEMTKGEKYDYRSVSIFKNGVTV